MRSQNNASSHFSKSTVCIAITFWDTNIVAGIPELFSELFCALRCIGTETKVEFDKSSTACSSKV